MSCSRNGNWTDAWRKLRWLVGKFRYVLCTLVYSALSISACMTFPFVPVSLCVLSFLTIALYVYIVLPSLSPSLIYLMLSPIYTSLFFPLIRSLSLSLSLSLAQSIGCFCFSLFVCKARMMKAAHMLLKPIPYFTQSENCVPHELYITHCVATCMWSYNAPGVLIRYMANCMIACEVGELTHCITNIRIAT